MTNDVSISEVQAVAMTLDARAENVVLVRQALEGAARKLGAEGRTLDDIKLAVTEACSNVVKYAYRQNTGSMTAGMSGANDAITVTVIDEGTWQERDESGGLEASGMGIPLMEAVTRSCEIETDESGTTIRMEFDLAGDPAAMDDLDD